MQKILVPLDGSDLAEVALPLAADLAPQLSATLYLVRIVSTARHMAASSLAGATGGIDGMSAVDIQAIEDAVALQTQEAERYLDEQAKVLRGKGLTVEAETCQGSAAEEIIRHAQDKDIDMIAISSHGRSGLGRLVFGSVCDKVMREAGIPVLVVKPPKAD
jgi:nucleotide-binding universal stress UspA family protein